LVVSLLYVLSRRVLAVAALLLRSREFKELEIVVLRRELAVLRRQVTRPRLDESDRVFLAAASRLLSRASRPSFFVRPDTLLGWHSQLVRKRWTYAGRAPGRPAIAEEIRALVLRLARENPRWGYQRIVGELAGVGQRVSATTVAKILRQADISAAGARAQLSWHEFLRTQVLIRLNETIGLAAEAHNWTYIRGAMDGFKDHGYCAHSESWIVPIRLRDFWYRDTRQVAFHPKIKGQKFYADLLATELKPRLTVP
jgi:hypothetical protein